MFKRTTWILTAICFFAFSCNISAQYWNGQDSLFGNEWIQFDQSYVKIPIAKDGMYRINQGLLQAQGVPGNVSGSQFQLWHLGEEVPIFVSTDQVFGTQDFILFHGKQNRGEFETHLYPEREKDQGNPAYSMFNDTINYFLTWHNRGGNQKMLAATSTPQNVPEEPFFIDHIQKVYADAHLKYCADLQCYEVYSIYDRGQGWAHSDRLEVFNDVLEAPFYVPTGPDPQLGVRAIANTVNHANTGRLRIFVNDENVTDASRTAASFPYLKQIWQTLPEDLVTPQMEIAVTGSNNPNDRYNISLVEFKYPRQFNFEQNSYYELTVGASPIPKNIVIRDFNGGNQLGVWNLTAQEYVLIDRENDGSYILGLEESNEERQLVLFNPNTIQNVTSARSTSFRDFSQVDPEFIIISHPQFMSGSNNPVQDYADYRSSNQGGAHRTLTVDINQLYDQFAYGVNYHPSSVRLFVQWFHRNWSNPEFVFIVGKAVENQRIRNSGPNDFFFVPTYGTPGADVLLVSDPKFNPLVPTGRLPVIESEEISTYLNKVMVHEAHVNRPQTLDDQSWTKRALHLSGGDLRLPTEIESLRRGLDTMANILGRGKTGMEVATFQKKTTGAVTVSDNLELTRMVNEGVSLITYFGHSFINLLDFQIIDDVNTLQPTDKYSVYMGMGCYAGQIHDATVRSYSEGWTLARERGSVAFIANSSAGFISSLEVMGRRIYGNYGDEFFAKPIGQSVFDAVASVINDNRSQQNELSFTRDTELAFSLNICGDPSIRLNTSNGADYIVDEKSVGIDLNVISVETDSLPLHFDIYNLGENVNDTIQVIGTQTLPNGEEKTLFELETQAPSFQKTIQINVPNFKEAAVGFNKVNIVVDAGQKVDELPIPSAEANNDLAHKGGEFCFYITSDDARPIFPENFGIVNESNVELIASTSDGVSPTSTYIIQIDTTEEFNSPWLKEERSQRKGGLIKWTPPVTMSEEEVYYWRISPDSTNRGSFSWRQSSFVFLENHDKGWNQSHYFQYLYDSFDTLKINPKNRRWEFENQFANLKIKNVVVNLPIFLRPAILTEQGLSWDYRDTYQSTLASGVYVSLYDPRTGEAVENPSPGLHGSVNNSGGPTRFFAFNTQEYSGRIALINFLRNEIPEEHMVVFMTIQDPQNGYGAATWAADVDSTINTSIFDVLEERGAQTIRNLAMQELPYIFAYQEGVPDFPVREATGNSTDNIEINLQVPGFYFRGGLTSVTVGPASEWKKFIWKRDELDPAEDQMVATITGINALGARTVLAQDIDLDEYDLSGVSAQVYPNLELTFEAIDTTSRSMPQLDHWRVTYNGLPELAVDSNDDFLFYNDTLQQGEMMSLQWAFENIGDYPTDSVSVRYNIVNPQNQVISSAATTPKTIPGQRINLEFNRSTIDLSGDYRLIVDVNPNQDIQEQHIWNNSLILPFHVVGDERNPILDVTFDGIHILDGDLVSAHPEIVIRLTDENQFLLLDDTSLFTLEIKYPNERDFRILSTTDPDVSFAPGSTGNNEAQISISRKFPEDGIYTLKIGGKDKSGNESGDLEYQTRFEIINEASISQIVNYPNPFTTSTQFVYTLTGEQAPSFFKIQILTVSGKVVREITSAEIGDLRVGRHMTAYRYDGTDSFGNPLANGVYLYRVVTRDQNGDMMKNRDVGIGNYFKNGWGKMVILR